MKNYKKLIESKNDYLACIQEVRNYTEAVSDGIKAIEDRIAAETEAAKNREAELQEIIQDPDRTETIKNMSRLELEALKQKKPAATESEKALLQDQLQLAREALNDARQLCVDFGEAVRAVKEELEASQREVNQVDSVIMEKWIQGAEEKAGKLK